MIIAQTSRQAPKRLSSSFYRRGVIPGGRSAFEKEDGQLARVVEVETLIGLAGDLETKAFAHDAVEGVAVLTVHLVLDELARSLKTALARLAPLFGRYHSP